MPKLKWDLRFAKENAEEIGKIHAFVSCDEDRVGGIVKRAAEYLKCSENTIYQYLYSDRINPPFELLHALVDATGGDPFILKYLQPEGWRLVKSTLPTPDKETIFQEICDNHPETVEYEQLLTAPVSNKKRDLERRQRQVQKMLATVKDEFVQDYVKWCDDHGLKP